MDEDANTAKVYRTQRLKTCFTGDWFDKSNCHEETLTKSESEPSEIITWRFRGFDWWMFSPLLQGALLNGELNVHPSMLLMLEPVKRPEKPFCSPKEDCIFPCWLNGSSSQALTADLTGRAFEKMGDFFLPLLKTKDVLRWCSSEAVLQESNLFRFFCPLSCGTELTGISASISLEMHVYFHFNSLSLCPLSSESFFLNSYISVAYFPLHGDVYS